MKIFVWCMGLALLLCACEGWPLYSTPYNPATAVPSGTPSVMTATPVVLPPMPTSTDTTIAESPTATLVPVTPSPTALHGSVNATILGCDTSIDILHGMGEVTNAYVNVTNTTPDAVLNLCATLNALDEGRPHPDKTKCVPTLASGFQVTFKLTVDSTYRENTPVQVDVTSGDSLLVRVGEATCKSIGILPVMPSWGTPQPLP